MNPVWSSWGLSLVDSWLKNDNWSCWGHSLVDSKLKKNQISYDSSLEPLRPFFNWFSIENWQISYESHLGLIYVRTWNTFCSTTMCHRSSHEPTAHNHLVVWLRYVCKPMALPSRADGYSSAQPWSSWEIFNWFLIEKWWNFIRIQPGALEAIF